MFELIIISEIWDQKDADLHTKGNFNWHRKVCVFLKKNDIHSHNVIKNPRTLQKEKLISDSPPIPYNQVPIL